MALANSVPPPQRVPKRKASAYADALFESQKEVLARTLVSLRLGHGLSQEALAYEAEVERSYVSLIERGQVNPSLRVLCQLAQRLGVSVSEMLGGGQVEYARLRQGSNALLLQEPSPASLMEQDRPSKADLRGHP